MGESVLHLQMKQRVSRELADEGYLVFEEPPFAPSWYMRWTAYRPDLFGVKTNAPGVQEYVLVECETRPSTRRLVAKNFKSVEIQARLHSELSLRQILVVPWGRLAGLDPSIRLAWEMWVYEGTTFRRYPRAGEGEKASCGSAGC
jgi:hypothetical protein